MAGRIQGITVEIGGDTTKLQTALKGVNTEIRNTQSQLRDVDKLLKLDPGNTELLAQKHRLLGDAVKETKEKLETLKTAAEQAEQALKDGTITQEQYDGLQREIAETEAKLKSLEAQANQSATALQNIAAKGEKLKTLGNNISNVGTRLLPVTGAVVGLGTAAVKVAADFDSAMSQVAAVSGATGAELDALRDKAREMGAKTKFSASEAAEAMNYMAMAGWKTEDMLSGIEGVMNLAAASGEDLATTSDIVTDALTAFGLTAADSGHFADILAAASSNANTNVAMMGETFKYCAPIAGALGFSAEDTAEAIGLMANAGIKGSQAGTALRTIMNNLTGDIQLSGQALGDVTIQTINADGSMRDLSDILADCRGAFSQLTESEQAQAAEALVGKNAMSGFLALMNAGEQKIPYSFSIEVEASGRTLENLLKAEDFAELARKDQETALRLFEYQDFVEAPFMQDIHVRALYDGLKGHGNRQNLLEEFLVALKAKEPVRLEVENHHLSYEKLDKPIKECLEVHASTWGHVQFQVSADGDFLEFPKKFFGPADFKDGICQVTYVVNPARMHGGRNLGAMMIATIRESVLVYVEAQGGDEELHIPHNRERENLGHYLQLRLKYEMKYGESKALRDLMRQELENLRQRNGETPLNVLLQAELMILEGQKERAEALLEAHQGELLDQRRDMPELYCFYQYLLHALQKKEGQRDTLIRLIRKCLLEENRHSYLFLLWLKMEPELLENPAGLLEQMRRLCDRGCCSPFVYLEAFRIWEKVPLLMHRLGKFEIQVLNFAVRRGLLERELAERAVELAGVVKHYSVSCHRLLAALYEKYPEKEFLSAVCAILIKGDCREEKYFSWYQKALETGVSLTRLYEYYLYSLPKDYPQLLPHEVLLYFSYEKSLDEYSRSLLYSNILKYMKPDYWKFYF